MAVKVGDVAPDFTLPSQTGKSMSLSNFKGQQPVVLYFYPKDDTPGCTAESCTFRDRYEAFSKAGVQVIGISGDSTDSHQKFASKYNLPFALLSDKDNRVRKLYGVPATFGLLPGRVTYVIDKDGVVRHMFNSQFNVKAHIEEAMKAIEQIAAKS